MLYALIGEDAPNTHEKRMAVRTEHLARLAALRGRGQVEIADSRLAGVPLRGRIEVQGDGSALRTTARAELDGNTLDAEGRLAAAHADNRRHERHTLPRHDPRSIKPHNAQRHAPPAWPPP